MSTSSTPLNADLPKDVYILWKPFTMPTDRGGKWAISVGDEASAYFLALYTIILGSMFGFFWQFITYLIITWYPTENESRAWSRKDRKDFLKDGTGSTPLLPHELLEVRRNKANRYIALVCVWNTTDPASAMLLLMEHAWIMCKTVGDQITCLLDVFVLLLTVGFMISAGAARVFIASTLFIGNDSPMGNVAPVNPSNIFYWLPGENRAMVIESFTFGVSSSQRSAGAVESISDDTRAKVSISRDNRSISYNYTITGVEFGLQHASYLTFPVRGKCELRSDNIDTTSEEQDVYYDPYLKGNITVPLKVSTRAPVAAADFGKDHNEVLKDGNSSFLLIFETAEQQSYYPSTDPVYETEEVESDPGRPQYKIIRARPFLHCYEQSYWSYKDLKIHNPQDIDQIPDHVVPGALKNELIPFHFSQSRFPNLVRTLGGAVLVSSSSSYGGVIDAGAASWHKDMERLILVNYVSSRNAFRDSASLTSLLKDHPERNAAIEDGVPKQGLGDFVVGTSKVTTMSITILVVIPVAWMLIWAIITVFRCNRCTSRNSGSASRFTLRAVGLQATQMYRLLDEEVCGDRDDWQGRKTHMPYILKAKAPKSPKHTASPVGFDTITNSPSPQLDTPVPLFAAPKVIGRDGKYQLKFTGPLKYDAKVDKNLRPWVWNDVDDGPSGEAKSSRDKVSKIDQNFGDKGIRH